MFLGRLGHLIWNGFLVKNLYINFLLPGDFRLQQNRLHTNLNRTNLELREGGYSVGGFKESSVA